MSKSTTSGGGPRRHVPAARRGRRRAPPAKRLSQPVKSLGLQRALEKMRHGSRLLLMHSNQSPHGVSYYVVPGGYIEPDEAKKIIARVDVYVFDDGLFPGISQSWKIGG